MLKNQGRVFQWLNRNEGAALIEFALILPVMALLLFGGAEATNYILVNQRVEKAGYMLTDITTQFQEQSAAVARPGELTQALMNNDIFPQMARVMGDGADPTKQVVILTSIRKEGGELRVKWQAAGGGTLADGVASQVNGLAPSGIGAGVRDTVANLPSDVATALGTMADGENVVVGEVFLRYEPMASAIIPAKTLNKSIFLHPRNDSSRLVCLPPDFVYPECTGGPVYAGTTCTPQSFCSGTDWLTRDCDGVITSALECSVGNNCPGSAPVSACDGNDFVTRNCKGRETARLPNDTSNGCMPVCSTATINQCTSGTPGNINAGSCGGNATWTCTGAGGSVANCARANAACPITGVCGGAEWTCNAGVAFDGYDSGCGGAKTWLCSGSNGGGNSPQCSVTNAACPPAVVDGVCGQQGYAGPGNGCPNTCAQGTVVNAWENVVRACPHCLYNVCVSGWQCQGTGGGATVNCSISGDDQ